MGDIAAECVHGLTADWCSLCKEHPRSLVRNQKSWKDCIDDWYPIRTPFTRAQFNSPCPNCSEEIAIDELIGMREPSEWWCNACTADHDINETRDRHPSGRNPAS